MIFLDHTISLDDDLLVMPNIGALRIVQLGFKCCHPPWATSHQTISKNRGLAAMSVHYWPLIDSELIVDVLSPSMYGNAMGGNMYL